MFPRLVADVPRMVTYSNDNSVDVKIKRLDEQSLPSEWVMNRNAEIEEILEKTKSEGSIVFTAENDRERDTVIIVEHNASEAD